MALNEQDSYPNQHLITITKAQIGPKDLYVRVRKDALRRAAQTLKAGAFKLYIYLSDNKDGYRLALSQVAVERDFGMKKNQYYNAIKELKSKGYLYQRNPPNSSWIFSEVGTAESVDHRTDEVDAAFPKQEDSQDEAFPKREGKEDQFFPNKEGIQGVTFPNQEDDQTFPKREWPKREDVVSKQENSFLNREEIFPKPIEKDNRKQEYKDNSMRRRRVDRPFYYLS